jgi:hypothetical protein
VAGVTRITNIDILTSVLGIRKERRMMIDIDSQQVALKENKKRCRVRRADGRVFIRRT